MTLIGDEYYLDDALNYLVDELGDCRPQDWPATLEDEILERRNDYPHTPASAAIAAWDYLMGDLVTLEREDQPA